MKYQIFVEKIIFRLLAFTLEEMKIKKVRFTTQNNKNEQNRTTKNPIEIYQSGDH